MHFACSRYNCCWLIVGRLSAKKGCLTSYYSTNVSFGTNALWDQKIRFSQRGNQNLVFQDGCRRPYWIIKKTLKIKYPIFLTLKPCQLWFLLLKTSCGNENQVPNKKKQEFSKSKMAAGGHLEKLEICHSQLILIVQSNAIHGFRWFWPS